MLAENTRAEIAAQTHRAGHDYLLILGQFVNMVAQYVERDIHRAGNSASRAFARHTHVKHEVALFQIFRISGGAKSGKDIFRDKAEHIHGAFRRIIRRRVAQFHLRQVVHGAAQFHYGGDYVYLLFHVLPARRLGAVNFPVFAEQQF